MQLDFSLIDHTHLLTVAGSRAYGTHTDDSDVDVKGVAVPPSAWVYSFQRAFQQADKAEQIAAFAPRMNAVEREVTSRTKLEGVVYGMRKFCRLAADANPNILDVLFCREQEVRQITEVGRALRDARELFVSAKARFTFSGYAAAQLKRIRTHRRWILHPPTHKPERHTFDLPPMPIMPRNQREAAEAAIQKRIDRWNIDYGDLEAAEKVRIEGKIAWWLAEVQTGTHDVQWIAAARHVGLGDNVIEAMRDERRYNSAVAEWQRYCSWKKARNPVRAALEEKHHYDTKHGAHLVRLMRMGEEIVRTGAVKVWRGADGGPGDAKELLAIRHGEWSYEQLMTWAEAQEHRLNDAYERNDYSIPRAPDRQAIDALCIDLMERALG